MQESLLRIAVGPAAAVAPTWRHVQPLDLDRLETGSFGLLPSVYKRCADVVPADPILPRLAGTYRNAWYRSHLALRDLADAVRALHGCRLDPLLVGAAPIALRWYADAGLRPVSQLDFVVEADRLHEATAALRAIGWRSTGGRRVTRLVNARETVLLLHRDVPLELSSLPVAPNPSLAPTSGLDLGGDVGSVRVLDPTDELVFVCALGARLAPPPLVQSALDAFHILRSLAVDPDRLVARGRHFHLLPAIRDTVRYVHEVSEDPAISAHASALEGARPSARDVLAHRFVAGPVVSQTVASYVRATAAQPLHRALRGLPAYLKREWQLESAFDVGGVAARKLIRRARRSLLATRQA